MRVGAIPDDDHAADRVGAVFVKHPATEFRADLHGGHVPHIHWCSIDAFQDDVLNILHRFSQAEAAHDELHVVGLNDLCPHVVVAACDCIKNHTDWNVVTAEFSRI